MATRNCPHCGRALDLGLANCVGCGRPWEAQPYALPSEYLGGVKGSPEWRRVRPLWAVGGLTFGSFGIYAFYWLYSTWRDLKGELQDQGMSPVWHALTQFVPVHGFYRFHAHGRVIKELCERAGVATSL